MTIVFNRTHVWDDPVANTRKLSRKGVQVAEYDKKTVALICSEDRSVHPWGFYKTPPSIEPASANPAVEPASAQGEKP